MGRVHRGARLEPGVVYEGTVAVPSIGTAFRGLATLTTTDGLATFWPTQRILMVVDEHCAKLDHLRPTDLPGGWPFWAKLAEWLATSTLARGAVLQRGHLYLMGDAPAVYLGPVTKVDDLGAHVGCDGWLQLANKSPGWLQLANSRQGGVQVWMDHLVDPLTMDNDELVDAVRLQIMSIPWSGAVADDHCALLDSAWFAQHPVLLGRGGVVALDDRADVEQLRALWALSG